MYEWFKRQDAAKKLSIALVLVIIFLGLVL